MKQAASPSFCAYAPLQHASVSADRGWPALDLLVRLLLPALPSSALKTGW